MDKINTSDIDKKWQSFWSQKKNKFSHTNKDKKFYCLEMFPYPSGKIHMGHVRNYAIGDVLARYKMINGFNVLHPMGWDAFGLPAENAAKENNLNPKDWTKKNISTMKHQLQLLGLSIDWDLEISTCDEDYYKHQQELFIDFYNKGLVVRKETYVNWDPVEKTVLANEQVIDGKGWRSNAVVERKKLFQWFFNISKFSDELLEDLSSLKEWPERVKLMQKNWIGKSVGCEIDFMPLVTVDYSGGMIITDWYTDSNTTNDSLKFTIRFLSNDIRADSLKIIIHKKTCKTQSSCIITKITSNRLEDTIRSDIIKKASILDADSKKKKKS